MEVKNSEVQDLDQDNDNLQKDAKEVKEVKEKRKDGESEDDEEIVDEDSDDEKDSEEERTEKITMGRVTNYDDWLERKT